MNINCTICSDLFSPHAAIYATSCGHLFHHHCLVQWIERSSTCPQCRHKETSKSIHQVFFNRTNSADENPDDIVALQAKIDNAHFQLSLKNKDIANYQEMYNKHNSTRVGLKEMSDKLTKEACDQKETISRTKEQLRYFIDRVTHSEKLQTEILRLKDEICTIGYMRTVINGCESEVEELLHVCGNPKVWCILLTVLRRQLIDADKKKQKLSDQLQADKKEMHQMQGKLKSLDIELNDLKHALSEHDKCPQIIKQLKCTLAELLHDDANETINRAVFESPAPQRPNFNQAFSDEMTKDSPTIEERIREIKNAKSPYLPIRGTAGSFTNLMQAKFTVKNGQATKAGPICDTYSIYNRKLDISRNKGGCNYNGLGGHSKEDIFPQPKKSPIISSTLKRAKPRGKLFATKSSAKLAPLKIK